MRNLRGELGASAHHLVGCVQVYNQKGDHRLLINAPNKATRRMLLGAIRRLRNGVKASPFLTAIEKTHKSLVYR
jgi:hypothetical protein